VEKWYNKMTPAGGLEIGKVFASGRIVYFGPFFKLQKQAEFLVLK
jgi:hypothetical protein